jgi:predicted phosphoribosyltransferase
VILIDDAVETGATMRAAIQSLRSMGATEFVIAAPIVAEPAYRALSALASKVFCLKTSPPGSAVHTTYAHFPPVTDADALALLEAHGKQRLAAALNGEDAGAEI